MTGENLFTTMQSYETADTIKAAKKYGESQQSPGKDGGGGTGPPN
jgi:hypothetical protein